VSFELEGLTGPLDSAAPARVTLFAAPFRSRTPAGPLGATRDGSPTWPTSRSTSAARADGPDRRARNGCPPYFHSTQARSSVTSAKGR
jgi:hypothetical protein